MEKKIKSINGMTFTSECTMDKEELRELIEEIGVGVAGSGWSLTAITLFEQLLKSLAYENSSVGKAIGVALIEELKNSPSGDNPGNEPGTDPGEEPGSDPESVEFTITYSLGDSTASNNVTSVKENESYVTELLPPVTGYIESVLIMMAGVDVTNSVFTDNVINIPQVTGNIIITVVTKKSDNLIDKTKLTDGETMPNGSVITPGTYLITDYIPIEMATLYYHNITRYISETESDWGQGLHIYDSDKKHISFNQSTTNAPMGTMVEFREAEKAGYVRLKFHVNYKDIIYFGQSGVM